MKWDISSLLILLIFMTAAAWLSIIRTDPAYILSQRQFRMINKTEARIVSMNRRTLEWPWSQAHVNYVGVWEHTLVGKI